MINRRRGYKRSPETVRRLSKSATKIYLAPGSVFGNLTIIKSARPIPMPSGPGDRRYLCKCSCGRTKSISLYRLIYGKSRSCGCKIGVTHGMSKSRLYNIHHGMINRCYGKYPVSKNIYYNRKISVCKQWKKSFISFKNWSMNNGYKDNLTLDRIDNNKGYYPSNCRYSSFIEQSNNRRNTKIVKYHNEKIPLSILLRKLNIFKNYARILWRINNGWNVDDAINVPVR